MANETLLSDPCPPCKLLLNGNMAAAKIKAFQDGLAYLRSTGRDLSADKYQEAIGVICKFDDDMDGVLKFVVEGPFVQQGVG